MIIMKMSSQNFLRIQLLISLFLVASCRHASRELITDKIGKSRQQEKCSCRPESSSTKSRESSSSSSPTPPYLNQYDLPQSPRRINKPLTESDRGIPGYMMHYPLPPPPPPPTSSYVATRAPTKPKSYFLIPTDSVVKASNRDDKSNRPERRILPPAVYYADESSSDFDNKSKNSNSNHKDIPSYLYSTRSGSSPSSHPPSSTPPQPNYSQPYNPSYPPYYNSSPQGSSPYPPQPTEPPSTPYPSTSYPSMMPPGYSPSSPPFSQPSLSDPPQSLANNNSPYPPGYPPPYDPSYPPPMDNSIYHSSPPPLPINKSRPGIGSYYDLVRHASPSIVRKASSGEIPSVVLGIQSALSAKTSHIDKNSIPSSETSPSLSSLSPPSSSSSSGETEYSPSHYPSYDQIQLLRKGLGKLIPLLHKKDNSNALHASSSIHTSFLPPSSQVSRPQFSSPLPPSPPTLPPSFESSLASLLPPSSSLSLSVSASPSSSSSLSSSSPGGMSHDRRFSLLLENYSKHPRYSSAGSSGGDHETSSSSIPSETLSGLTRSSFRDGGSKPRMKLYKD